MEVSGFDTEWEMLNGVYRKESKPHHRKPVYKKRGGEEGIDTYIYFWDDPDESFMTGWWIAPSVGGDDGFAISKAGNAKAIPPPHGWKVLETGEGEGNGSKSNIVVMPLVEDNKHTDCYIPRSTDCARDDGSNRHAPQPAIDGDSRGSSQIKRDVKGQRSSDRSRSLRTNRRSPGRPSREVETSRECPRNRSRSPLPPRKSFSALRPIVLGRSPNTAQKGDRLAPRGRSPLNPAARSLAEPRRDGQGEPRRGSKGEVRRDGQGEVRLDGKGEVRRDGKGEVRRDGQGEVRRDGKGEVRRDGKGEKSDGKERKGGRIGLATQGEQNGKGTSSRSGSTEREMKGQPPGFSKSDAKGKPMRLVPRGGSPASEDGKGSASNFSSRTELNWSVRDLAAPKSRPGSKSGKGPPSKGTTVDQSELRSSDSDEDSGVERSDEAFDDHPQATTRRAARGAREVPKKNDARGFPKKFPVGTGTPAQMSMLPGSMATNALAKASEGARTRTENNSLETIERLQKQLDAALSDKSNVLERLHNEILSRQQMVEDMAGFVVSVEKRQAGGVFNEHCAWQLMEKWQSNDGSQSIGTLSAAIMRAISRAKPSRRNEENNMKGKRSLP